VSIIKTTPKAQKIISMAEAVNISREWGNGRGDI